MKFILSRIALLSLACTTLVAIGCGDLLVAKSAAEKKIAEFHRNYDGSNFELIYNNTHPEFKKIESYEEFDELMAAVHRKLGLVSSTTNRGWQVNTENSVTSAILQQETIFENGTGIETFTFFIEDERALIAGYTINSRALIIN